MAAEKEVKAQVKLRFKAANGHPMLVTRNLSVTLKKTSGMTMKTLEAILAALPREGGDGKVRYGRLCHNERD
jgi:DNA repair protein RAD50